ncbi:MAG: FtsW/RodA/SpoVE family cell cycle protein [Planctomycetes bacterium]|nr:FtsW/RodA/SpoVE family cell cycle protein [Planctomycetota bacterium]
MLERIWQGRRGGLRTLMVLAVGLLLLAGLTIIKHYAPANFNRQLMWLVISAVAFCAVNLIHYRTLGQISYRLFAITLFLLAVILIAKSLPIRVPFIPMINGAHRWIRLGPLQIQPSEMAKLAYVLALAWYLRQRTTHRTLKGLMLPILFTALPMLLILLEPDLGTVLLFIPVFFAQLFMAGARLRHLALIMITACLLAWPAYLLMPSYQQSRVQVLLRQNETSRHWLMNQGYQLDQSKTYIGSGQLTGYQGKELPTPMRYKLPHGHNDFIFSLIAHRWGFAGACCLLLLYLLLFLGAVEIASNQPDPYGRLVAIGIAALFATQTIVNIAMTMGLAPITGITLPFISYGGSSLLSSFLALGLLTNVARHRPHNTFHPPFEFND